MSGSPATGYKICPDAFVSERARGVLLLVLGCLALLAAAYFAKPILAPTLFAMVIGVVVAPVADRLNDVGIPRVVTASVLLIIVISFMLFAFIMLEPLLSAIASQWPKIRAEIQSWIFALSDLLRGIETISSEIEKTVGGDNDDDTTDIPSVMDAIWLAPGIGAQIFIFVGTLFFFVLTRNEIYNWFNGYRRSLFAAEQAVARYFAIVTLINTVLGVATGFVLMMLGVQGALLWGLAAGVLNFILYLGPLLIAVSLLVVGLIQFGGFMVLAPPFAFLCLNLVEAQFITPSLVGKRMDMNPLAVFLAITFGLWIWGPIGAIVALPLALWIGVLLGKTSRVDEKAVQASHAMAS